MTGSDRAGQQYQLVVEGELDDRFGFLFEGMRLEREHGTTVATGTLVDQTHLLGVIEQFHELGLELRSFEQVRSSD